MEGLRKNYKRLISPTLAKYLIIFLVNILVFDFCLFPLPTLADKSLEEGQNQGKLVESVSEENNTNAFLPENADLKVKFASFYLITAYNSESGQCDASPCITANGFDVCKHGYEDTIATNFLPFGSKVRLPELFGDRVFTVRDRMNPRYYNRIDIWMLEKMEAKKFGVKLGKVEVLE